MRRMIRAYEQDLLSVLNAPEPHPDEHRIHKHLERLEELRRRTFDPFEQTITF